QSKDAFAQKLLSPETKQALSGLITIPHTTVSGQCKDCIRCRCQYGPQPHLPLKRRFLCQPALGDVVVRNNNPGWTRPADAGDGHVKPAILGRAVAGVLARELIEITGKNPANARGCLLSWQGIRSLAAEEVVLPQAAV